jgi:hypothetical protein
MTKETIRELRWVAEWAQHHLDKSKIINDGADAIEALQARVAELYRSETQLIQERDEREEVINALCDAVLAALKSQKPVIEAHDNCRSEKICRSWCGNSACVSHYATTPPVREES